MINVEDIKQLGLTITWRLLYNGLCHCQISTSDIIEYAMEKLEEGDDENEVCEIAGEYADNKDEICDLLYDLIESDTSDDMENRKIRIVVVNKVLKNKNDNFINGLIELTELWIGLGYPADVPHIIQGRDNDISPTEYYTQENYDILFEKNKEWLTRELEYLTHQ